MIADPTDDLFAPLSPPTMEPTRAAGRERLSSFLPRAGRQYAKARSFDFGPDERSNISMLSPWIRHRLVREDEIVEAVIRRHGFHSAEKFVQEVVWRTYWKGWLEMRPTVWSRYRAAVAEQVASLETDRALRHRWEAATSGRTGISCFDAWVGELLDFGYLHNHARMWFASIWIFTLELPWELGADFFLRTLLDGDPASNTLSWRWVAGLQTRGKTYLARADNIETFTKGRFPSVPGLAEIAVPRPDDGPVPASQIPEADRVPSRGPVGLLITEEDCDPMSFGLPLDQVRAAAAVSMTSRRSPMPAAERPSAFSAGAVADALERTRDACGCPAVSWLEVPSAEEVAGWAVSAGVAQIITTYVPVGPTAEWLDDLRETLAQAGVGVSRLRRDWDTVLWPHATKGFFPFKEKLPAALRDLGIG